jgi:hypothetical protein
MTGAAHLIWRADRVHKHPAPISSLQLTPIQFALNERALLVLQKLHQRRSGRRGAAADLKQSARQVMTRLVAILITLFLVAIPATADVALWPAPVLDGHPGLR